MKVVAGIAIALWFLGMVAAFFMPSQPGNGVPWLLSMAAIALIPAVVGSRRLRIFGIAAVVVTLFAAWQEEQVRRARPARHPPVVLKQ